MTFPEKEHAFIHELDVEFAALNEYGILKPSAYQALFAQLAERHLAVYRADSNETLQFGLSWALIGISIEVGRPIDRCMRLYASTWYSGRTGPYFRRELLFRDEAGAIRFQGSTFSVLLDVANRTVYRKKELPFPLTEPRPVHCIDAEPRFRPEGHFPAGEIRQVRNSDIDNLGHMNNRRYGDLAYDALEDREIRALAGLSRLDFHFVSELRKGDSVAIAKVRDEAGFRVRGTRPDSGETAFEIRFRLTPEGV